MSEQVIKKKICLLGAFGVGKTSLVQRFVYNRFEEKYLSTIGVRVAQKDVQPVSGQPLMRMLIWDIEGYEAGKAINKNYYIGASGGILVADVTRPDTFSELERIVKQFKNVNPDAALILAVNKIDLIEDTDFIEERLNQLNADWANKHYPTSAKNGLNVPELFFYLYDKLIV